MAHPLAMTYAERRKARQGFHSIGAKEVTTLKKRPVHRQLSCLPSSATRRVSYQ